MMEAGIVLSANSNGFILNAQMEMKKLQRLNKEFFQKAIDAKTEMKKLKTKASTADQIIKTEVMSQLELLTTENTN